MRELHAQPQAPRRGTYLVPSLFTMANVFCGYFAITESFKGGLLVGTDLSAAAQHFDTAAKAIGFAVLFDGLDGRIARLMGTSSAFGRELDSLADAIAFGIAPSLLAILWGVYAVLPSPETPLIINLGKAGWVTSFLFVICGVARLARFNIQSAPSLSHPSRRDHKHFVGLPIPAAAGLVAAVVHFNSGKPIGEWLWVPFWLVLLAGVSLLMVSTWRYYSFKALDLRRKRKFVVVIGVGGIVALIWFYSHVVLLLIASGYLLSGVVAKLSQVARRGRLKVPTEQREP